MSPVSRFMLKTLMPDEKIVREARFHPFYTFVCYFALASLAALGAAVQYGLYLYAGVWSWIPVSTGVFLGAWICFWMLMRKWTTEIVLTNHRLIYKTGFFLIDAHEVDIEQLASDHVVQTLLGRLLDYGGVHMRCVEATDIIIPDIADPYAFRNAIENEKHNYRENYVKVERLRRSGAGEAAG